MDRTAAHRADGARVAAMMAGAGGVSHVTGGVGRTAAGRGARTSAPPRPLVIAGC